jgi:hypothetical protein
MIEKWALPLSILVASLILSVEFRFEMTPTTDKRWVYVHDRWTGAITLCGISGEGDESAKCFRFPNSSEFAPSAALKLDTP